MHQDLADLDALAAGAQRVLHALPAADDGHPAQLLRKVHADVGVACRGHHALLPERQVPQAVLHHLQEASTASQRPPKRCSICMPMYGWPVADTTHFSRNGRCPRLCSTTCRKFSTFQQRPPNDAGSASCWHHVMAERIFNSATLPCSKHRSFARELRLLRPTAKGLIMVVCKLARLLAIGRSP